MSWGCKGPGLLAFGSWLLALNSERLGLSYALEHSSPNCGPKRIDRHQQARSYIEVSFEPKANGSHSESFVSVFISE